MKPSLAVGRAFAQKTNTNQRHVQYTLLRAMRCLPASRRAEEPENPYIPLAQCPASEDEMKRTSHGGQPNWYVDHPDAVNLLISTRTLSGCPLYPF